MNLPDLKPIRRPLAVALLALACWLALPFLIPSRGLDRAWSRLLDAIEERDDATLHAIVADDYGDTFGFDRDGLIEALSLTSRQFVSLNIRRERPSAELAGSGRATTGAILRVSGHGSPGATIVIQGSTRIDTPTVFRWRRASWRPWDWRLVSIDNPALRDDVFRLKRQLQRIETETGGWQFR